MTPCARYEQLKIEFKKARDEWLYFMSLGSRTFGGPSDQKASQIGEEWHAKMEEGRKQILAHPPLCPDCRMD